MNPLIFLSFGLVFLIQSALSVVAPVGKCNFPVIPIGPCLTGKPGKCGSGYGDFPGYACDQSLKHCCPTVNTFDTKYFMGPGVSGMCPMGYAIVYGLSTSMLDPGMCIDLNSTNY